MPIMRSKRAVTPAMKLFRQTRATKNPLDNCNETQNVFAGAGILGLVEERGFGEDASGAGEDGEVREGSGRWRRSAASVCGET